MFKFFVSLMAAAALYAPLSAHANRDLSLSEYRECLRNNREDSLTQADRRALFSYLSYLADSTEVRANRFIRIYRAALATHPRSEGASNLSLFEGGDGSYCYNSQGELIYWMGKATSDYLMTKALRGDRSAIKIVLVYSAVYPTDGADAEVLADAQAKLRRAHPRTIASIIRENREFFRRHPVRWIPQS